MKIGPVEWMASDEYCRPTLWLSLPRSYIVVVEGWEWPPRLVWLR